MVPLHSFMDPDHGMAGLKFRQIRPRLVEPFKLGQILHLIKILRTRTKPVLSDSLALADNGNIT